MCGIYCSVRFCRNHSTQYLEKKFNEIPSLTESLLIHRGPNLSHIHQCTTPDHEIFLAGFVLWQQGDKPCKQPVVFNEHVLLLNGDLYMNRPDRSKSDTFWLIEEIDKCKNEQNLFDLFKILEGPYGIIYYNSTTDTLYIARDSLGRQSLIFGWENDRFVVSSVFATPENPENFAELPPVGIFKIKSKKIDLIPWQCFSINFNEIYGEQIKLLEQFFNGPILIKNPIEPDWLTSFNSSLSDTFNFEEHFDTIDNWKDVKPNDLFEKLLENQRISNTCDKILCLLNTSIEDRIRETPNFCKNCLKLSQNDSKVTCSHARIGILFSGGIDCTILACLADKYIDESIPIDLLNVSFEKINRMGGQQVQVENIDFGSPDRISALQTIEELKIIAPLRKWNLIEVNVSRKERNSVTKHISDLMFPLKTVLDDSVGTALWFAASGKGICAEKPFKSFCRVLLIGSGADELFGGYTRHRNAFIRNRTAAGDHWHCLKKELDYDWDRLPSRNLARDDRVLGDHGITARSPYISESLTAFVRSLAVHQKCFHELEQGVGDKLLLRLCGFKLGLRQVCWLKKRALQFGSRIADSRQNAKDLAVS